MRPTSSVDDGSNTRRGVHSWVPDQFCQVDEACAWSVDASGGGGGGGGSGSWQRTASIAPLCCHVKTAKQTR
jgi:hypothetical protein